MIPLSDGNQRREMMGVYHWLTREERYQIEALLESGRSLRQIARQLQRSPSTLSRELRRAGPPYRALEAQGRTESLRKRPHPEKQKIRGALKNYVDERIARDWSPEQIAGRLQFQESSKSLSHQTIYRYLHRERASRPELWNHLRMLRKTRKNNRPPHRPTRLEGRTMIEKRPAVVEQRTRLGDFERDTLFGKADGSLLLTIVDRTSRLLKIKWIPKKTSDLIHYATVELLRKEPVRTITNDNGTEFSWHPTTAKALKTRIYFSRAYRAWERGTNENTNGLLRQYFPRKKDIGQPSAGYIKAIQDRINRRPKKCLGYQTPLEVHRQLLRQVLR
jgi:IS30 family transposase